LSGSAAPGRERVQPSKATDRDHAATAEPSEAKRALRRNVVTVVQSAVVPVVDDIQRALASEDPAHDLDWAGLGQRLQALHAEVIDVVDSFTDSEHARQGVEVRAELFEVMHGPVLGRLAACAMALNFHCDPSPSASASGGAAAAAIATRVRAHLHAVSRDLAELRRRAA
jgi:hypothetical protein